MKTAKILLVLSFFLIHLLYTNIIQAQSRYESKGSGSADTTIKVQMRQAQKASVTFQKPFKNKTKVVAQNGYYTLEACINSETTPSVEVFVNGKLQKNRDFKVVRASEKSKSQTCTHNIQHGFSLQEGNNTIYLKVKNTAGETKTEPYHIHYTYISPEKRIALVVGNQKYKYGGRLTNPINDATIIADSLKSLDFDVWLHTDLTQKKLKAVIDTFGSVQNKYDVALFYYAGHGIQVRSGRYNANYLMPIDANPKTEKQAEYDCVALGRVLSAMELGNNKANIVILDACRNNPFERNWASRSLGGGHGLASINAPLNYFIAYATSIGKTVPDGYEDTKHAPYTHELLKHLTKPGLKIDDLFRMVTKSVYQKSKQKQVPWKASSLIEPFYFVMPK